MKKHFTITMIALVASSGHSFIVGTSMQLGHVNEPVRASTRLPISDGDLPVSVIASDDSGETREEESANPPPKCPDCDLCDGSGRILGGIGAVLPWVPIKAYRPCPNFVERGGRYQRSGQGLDEIAFGRDSSFKRDD